MDEMKWAWVLFVAATLALLIRLAMWFLPAPGWRSEKVAAAAGEEPETEATAGPASVLAEEPVEPAAEATATEPAFPPEPPAAVPAPVPEVAPVAPAAPPEEFHLRRVRWGMSQAEVRASETGVPVQETANRVTFMTLTGELPCLLSYFFNDGHLVRARMAFSDPSGEQIPPLSVAQAQRRFLHLRELLQARYGEPVQSTVTQPRNVADLHRRVQHQAELARQYDREIAEAEERMRTQREALEARYRKWSNRAEMVARGLAPLERDLRDLRAWKQEALAAADQSRRGIEQNQAEDSRRPLVAVMTARWPFARELHDIELQLDLRGAVPRLDIRYSATQALPGWEPNAL